MLFVIPKSEEKQLEKRVNALSKKRQYLFHKFSNDRLGEILKFLDFLESQDSEF